MVYIFVYVDDIVITGNNSFVINKVINDIAG